MVHLCSRAKCHRASGIGRLRWHTFAAFQRGFLVVAVEPSLVHFHAASQHGLVVEAMGALFCMPFQGFATWHWVSSLVHFDCFAAVSVVRWPLFGTPLRSFATGFQVVAFGAFTSLRGFACCLFGCGSGSLLWYTFEALQRGFVAAAMEPSSVQL